ncbi:putative reverse transcriptase domain-containing protein [Tanacetum coccineum]
MPPKRTSTSETPAITLAAIRQLINDGISSALKAQAALMASASNTNKNTGTSRTPVARKGINDHKRKFEDRGNTTNNNNYPKHNNNNHSNNRNNNNYQDNNNKNNHNNNYHHQQNRRQETFKTYTATNGYTGNRPLCERCTLHHIGPCTVKCRTCNKIGHLTKNCRNKRSTTRTNLQTVSVTCNACGKNGHYANRCSKANNRATGKHT